MKGYKGFNRGLICKEKQYTEDTLFKEEKAIPCETGMHFCKELIDVLSFYSIIDDNCNFNNFTDVETLDEPITDDEIKYVSTALKIGTKLNFEDFVHICTSNSTNNADYAHIHSWNPYVKITNNKSDVHISTSGVDPHVINSGNFADINNSGIDGQFINNGDYSFINNSGLYVKIANSGNNVNIANEGTSARIYNAGDDVKIISNGYGTKINSTGKNSVITCISREGRVKATKGSWITLAEYDKNILVCIKTEQVDGEIIKENVFYTLKNGEFVEV